MECQVISLRCHLSISQRKEYGEGCRLWTHKRLQVQINWTPLVLREIADVIAPVITRLYRASLKQAKTPDVWKEAHVTPVFKKGEKYKAVNYRPVSLTCILCKQMEHILASNLMKHLNSNHLLYSKQHGFRSKLSYETQLMEYTSDVLKTV